MQYIIYAKNSKKIVASRYDDSTALSFSTAQKWLEVHCEDNDWDVNDFVVLEYPYDKKMGTFNSKHIFNESTGKVEVDPNWVQPLPSTPREEPTA
jgi:hypothetical protein